MVGQVRATPTLSPSEVASQVTSSSADSKYDVYDWLAYHSRLESQNRFAVKRLEIEKERTNTMCFSPRINSRSEVMANKKRTEKLRSYASTLASTPESQPHSSSSNSSSSSSSSSDSSSSSKKTPTSAAATTSLSALNQADSDSTRPCC